MVGIYIGFSYCKDAKNIFNYTQGDDSQKMKKELF